MPNNVMVAASPLVTTTTVTHGSAAHASNPSRSAGAAQSGSTPLKAPIESAPLSIPACTDSCWDVLSPSEDFSIDGWTLNFIVKDRHTHRPLRDSKLEGMFRWHSQMAFRWRAMAMMAEVAVVALWGAVGDSRRWEYVVGESMVGRSLTDALSSFPLPSPSILLSTSNFALSTFPSFVPVVSLDVLLSSAVSLFLLNPHSNPLWTLSCSLFISILMVTSVAFNPNSYDTYIPTLLSSYPLFVSQFLSYSLVIYLTLLSFVTFIFSIPHICWLRVSKYFGGVLYVCRIVYEVLRWYDLYHNSTSLSVSWIDHPCAILLKLSLLAPVVFVLGFTSVWINYCQETSDRMLFWNEQRVEYYNQRHPTKKVDLNASAPLATSWAQENDKEKVEDVPFNPVFIIGYHRSGTTFLYSSLSSLLPVGSHSPYTHLHFPSLMKHHEEGNVSQWIDKVNTYFQCIGLTTRLSDNVSIHALAASEEYGYIVNMQMTSWQLWKSVCAAIYRGVKQCGWRGLLLSDVFESSVKIHSQSVPIFHSLCRKIVKLFKPYNGVVLMKNPWDYGNEVEILKHYPHAKFIHLRRDHLQVLNSCLQCAIHHSSYRQFDPYAWIGLTGQPRKALCLERLIWGYLGEDKGIKRHWDRVLHRHLGIVDIASSIDRMVEEGKIPKHQIHSLDYNDLINHTNREMQKIVDFIYGDSDKANGDVSHVVAKDEEKEPSTSPSSGSTSSSPLFSPHPSCSPFFDYKSLRIDLKSNPRPFRPLPVMANDIERVKIMLRQAGVGCDNEKPKAIVESETERNSAAALST